MIEDNSSRQEFDGGSVLVYDYTEPVQDVDDLKIYVGDPLTITDADLKTKGSDYTAILLNNGIDGARLDFTLMASVSGLKIIVLRDVPESNQVDLGIVGNWNAETLNRMFTKLTMMSQQLTEQMNRALLFPVTSLVDSPMDVPLAGLYPRVKSDLSGIEFTALATTGAAVAGDPTSIDTVRDKLASDYDIARGIQEKKNLAVGGSFDLWPEGTLFTDALADMVVAKVFFLKTVSSQSTISRQSFTPGQTAVPGNPLYFMRCQQDSASGRIRLVLRIYAEELGMLSGEQLSLSFWAKSSINTPLENVFIAQDGFASGARTDTAATLAEGLTLSTSWAKKTATVTLPSVTGKTLGVGAYVDIDFYLPSATSGAVIDFAQIQLERGAVVTDFEKLSIREQNNLIEGVCQPRENYVINQRFDFWQRATTFATPGSLTYTADRWLVGYDGTIGAFTVDRQPFTLGQTDVPGEPAYFYRWDQTTAGSGSTTRVLATRIRGVRHLAGKIATLSFWAKADAVRTVSVNLVQNFGTGGSPSANVDGAIRSFNLSTTWQKFVYTFLVPSISGKTLGTDLNDYIQPTFVVPVNVLMTIDIANVKVEEGLVATEIVPRQEQIEKGMCERFYRLLGYDLEGSALDAVTIFVSASFNGNDGMIAAPTATLMGTTPIFMKLATGQFTGTASALTVSEANRKSWKGFINGFTGFTAGDTVQGDMDSIVGLEAEL